MKSWMLVVALLLVASGAVGAMMFQKAEGAGRKEGFDAETKSDENREIDGVLAAYRKIKGMVPSASDVKRVIKRMRTLRQDDPEEIIRREHEQAKPAPAKRKENFDPNEYKRVDADDEPGAAEAGGTAEHKQAETAHKQAETAHKQAEPKQADPSRAEPAFRNPLDKRAPAPDGASLRRIEDELEAVADRIDRLLEEIQAMRKRVVSGPLQDDAVETFVPYFPL